MRPAFCQSTQARLPHYTVAMGRDARCHLRFPCHRCVPPSRNRCPLGRDAPSPPSCLALGSALSSARPLSIRTALPSAPLTCPECGNSRMQVFVDQSKCPLSGPREETNAFQSSAEGHFPQDALVTVTCWMTGFADLIQRRSTSNPTDATGLSKAPLLGQPLPPFPGPQPSLPAEDLVPSLTPSLGSQSRPTGPGATRGRTARSLGVRRAGRTVRGEGSAPHAEESRRRGPRTAWGEGSGAERGARPRGGEKGRDAAPRRGARVSPPGRPAGGSGSLTARRRGPCATRASRRDGAAALRAPRVRVARSVPEAPQQAREMTVTRVLR